MIVAIKYDKYYNEYMECKVAMGNSCEHERTEIVEVVSEDKGVCFTDKIVIVRCKDCLTDGKPTTIKKTIREGNITGAVYSYEVNNPKTCKHSKFDVDASTEKYRKE